MSYLDLIDKMDKLPVYADIDTLNIYCEYLMNADNKNINFANLMNLKDFIDSIDGMIFINNDAKMARYYFIKYFLEAKLDDGVTSKKLIHKHILENVNSRYVNIIKHEILESYDNCSLSKKDIDFINAMVFAQMNNLFMHKYKIPLMRMIEDVNNNVFVDNPEDGISLLQTLLSELTKAQRRSKQENRFNLSDERLFKSVMQEACDRLQSDSQFLMTGWQGLNIMLNGGIENGRVYNIIGGTGGFKSGLLLNLMKGVKKYNTKRPPKDPTKRKTILFISQENNIWETILRIFNIFATTDSIKNYTFSEIMELLKKGGFKIITEEGEIDLEFRYYGNEDIGVADIRGIVEELDNEGREVICIFQDYIERLRPPRRNQERRLQLADITNQLHDLAVDLDVAIITASQFNKEGVAIVEEMNNKNKADVGRSIGTKNISESFGMLKNIDVNIAIVVEYDVKERKYYLSFNKLKFRGADDMSIMYFLQPFEGNDSKIMLMEDVMYKKALYKLTINGNLTDDMVDASKNLNKSARTRKSMKEAFDIDIADEEIEFISNIEESIKKVKKEQKSYTYNANGQIKLKFKKAI